MKTILKSVFIFCLLIISVTFCQAQSTYHIDLNVSPVKAELRGVTFICDSVTLRVNTDGTIKLNPSRNGDTEYWSAADGVFRKGKLKSIAGTPIEYYDNFDIDKIGRLKSVGSVIIDYYTKFDGPDNIGKIKSIGSITFKYYDRFDADPELAGRIKSVGDDDFTYYTKFDGPDNIGKLKSIGATFMTYFDRFAGREYLGRVKSVKGATTHLFISQE
jgi:hypothetical protein